MRKILLLFLITFLSSPLFAATFVVTSNADSGPGTLRQALLDAAANGSAEKDYINFNLPDLSEAGRTIVLTAQLPDVTGNVIIDGTTQPGNKFGVSDAKVTITVAIPKPGLNAFNVSIFVNSTDAVEFYGLYIKGFSARGSAIVLTSACKLIVGAPKKGNIITGNEYAIVGELKNAIVQGNFLGIASDGVSPASNLVDMANRSSCDNLLIGGNLPQEGNVILDGLHFYGDMPVGGTINIINNFFGTNDKGDLAIENLDIGGFIGLNGYSITLNINNNVFSANYTAISGSNQAKFVIKGNFFGTDRTQTHPLGHNNNEAISGLSNVVAVIGGETDSEQNVFTNYGNVFHCDNVSKFEVIKNTFYCNSDIWLQSFPFTPYNYIRLITLTDNQVSGDAFPGAKIQLYYSSDDCGYCNPKTWFATVIANSNGVWTYNGPVAGKVLVSATVDHQTVGFEPFSIAATDVTITPLNCNHGGLIEINEKRQGKFTFVWKNGKGVVVGTGQKIDNLPSGTYRLEISEEGGCPTAKGEFSVPDVLPHMDSGSLTLDCSHSTTDITPYVYNLLTGPVVYNWIDSNGKLISSQKTLINVGPGTYFVYLIDKNGCESEHAKYIVLPPEDAPIIDESLISIANADCGSGNGAIKNLTVTGYSGGSYGWVNEGNGIIFPNIYDLINVPAGKYHFFLDYSANCSVQSKTITIPELNGITLDDAQKVITQATCQFNNGSIANIKTTGATDFKWYNSINPNVVVATTADLINAPAGNYYLIASNAGGCSKQSPVYAITQQPTFTTAGISKILKNATCGQNNGRIEVIFLPVVPGNVVSTVVSYRWVNHATGQTIAGVTGPVLDNIDAGSYDIYGTNDTGCERFLITYSIGRTAGVTINPVGLKVVNDACATGKGSIKGITVSGSSLLTYLWADANGKPVGNNADLVNLKAGSYTLTVTATDLNCVQTYGPVNVTDVSAAQIDQSTAVMKPATCGQSNGSITGITVTGTGTIKYQWRDALGNPVGTNKDLTGQRAAVYFLQVTDDSACGPISSTYIAITETNGITIDDSQKIIGQATCQADDGSITNIKTTGATIFKWFNSANTVVAYTADLTNAPTGSYYLQASNALGCIKQSAVYVITRDAGPNLGGLSKILKNASCGLNNGSIEVLFQNLPAGAVTGYRWVNHATGAVVKNTSVPILTNIDAGTYDIYVTGNTACERFLISYTIGRNPDMDVNTTNAKITDDACQANTGSITGIGITGTSPLSYYWTDDKGGVVSNTVDLKNVKAGTYLLNIKDGSGCQQGVVFIIKSTTLVLTAPAVKEIQLCTAGDAIITLPGLTAGYGYRLYNSLTDAQPIDVGTTDKFKVKALQSRSYYVSLYSGNCESARAEVKISVGISLQNLVNTFSPNGDGINDLWKIPGIENYPGAIVKIFTRNGDLVFSSIGYETAFDGNYKGKPLPSGSYYYIINLNSGCSLLSGNLTINR